MKMDVLISAVLGGQGLRNLIKFIQICVRIKTLTSTLSLAY